MAIKKGERFEHNKEKKPKQILNTDAFHREPSWNEVER